MPSYAAQASRETTVRADQSRFTYTVGLRNLQVILHQTIQACTIAAYARRGAGGNQLRRPHFYRQRVCGEQPFAQVQKQCDISKRLFEVAIVQHDTLDFSCEGHNTKLGARDDEIGTK